MKKLLIATMAAVSVGLYAKATDTGFTDNGTSFEDPDEFDSNGRLVIQSQAGYWENDVAASDDLYTVTNLPENTSYPSRPAMWAGVTNGKALAIDASAPLIRNVNAMSQVEVGGEQKLVFPAQDVSSNPVFFDSVVQFTATDVKPTLDLSNDAGNKDKLLVWLYQSPDGVSGDNLGEFGEDTAETKLVITAGVLQNGGVVQKDYKTDVPIVSDSWHRLTIKSFIKEDRLMFNVWVDGTQVVIDEGETEVSDFLSLVPAIKDVTLQGVAFDGKGAVDDIVFTTTAPEFAQEDDDEEEIYSLTLNFDSNVEIYQFQIGGVTVENVASGSSYTIPVDVQMYLNVLPANGYELTFEGASFNQDGFGGYECTITPTAVGAGTITIKAVPSGSGDKPTIGGTAYDGDGLVAEAKSGAQITVPSDGWSVEGNVLKDAKGDAFATFAAYYVLTKDGTTVTVALDQKAAAPFAEATDLTEGQEVFELGEEEDGDAFVGVRVKTFPGLWYGLGTAAELGTWSEPAKWAEGGDGTVIQLKADRDPNAKAGFFKVRVVDVKPQQENSGN